MTDIDEQKNLETIAKEWAPFIIMLVRAHIGSEERLLKEIEDELVALSYLSFGTAFSYAKRVVVIDEP